ncbi:hypothetical protein C8R44DRAFT_726504 [Mycena epipterygia]|nr:hypothetical protein C8R44DRAFT_726504 [Mycena epipterygia]
MGFFASYRDSFKHPGSKYTAEVNSLSPADLQLREADLRRQEVRLTTSQTALTASAVGITTLSHGLLIHAGAVAGIEALVARHRKHCVHDKLELVRRVMDERCIQALPKSFRRDVVAPILLGTAPTIVAAGITAIDHAAEIPNSASTHLAVGAGNVPSEAHQVFQGVVDGGQHEIQVLEHPDHYILTDDTGTYFYHLGFEGGEEILEEIPQEICGSGLPEVANWVDERLSRLNLKGHDS